MLWKSDLNKSVVIDNFKSRNWEETDDDGCTLNNLENWSIYWASVQTVRSIFHHKNGFRLNDDQFEMKLNQNIEPFPKFH